MAKPVKSSESPTYGKLKCESCDKTDVALFDCTDCICLFLH